MLRIGIQGGRGSFNEEALVVATVQEGIAQYEVVYCYTTERVLRALSSGAVERGIFAVYNTQSHLVDETVAMFGHYPFDVMRVVTIPIRQCLMMRRGMMLSEATVIMGHEEAFAQCRKTLECKYAHIPQRSGYGTLKDGAGVARAIAHGDSAIAPTTAVLGSVAIADAFAMDIVARDIHDNPANATTFFFVQQYE